MLTSWEKLPDRLRIPEVRPYYDILKKNGVNAVLTRSKDEWVELYDRAPFANDLDAVFFISTSAQTRQVPVKYMTGYTLITRSAYIFKKKGELPFLVVPTVGQQYNAQMVTWLPDDHVLCGGVEIIDAKIRELGKAKPRIGRYEPNEVTVGLNRQLEKIECEYVDVTYEFTFKRACKSDYELECILETGKVAAASFEYIVRNIAPGVSENDLIGGAEGFLRAHGAQDMLILTRTLTPHTFITRPTRETVKEDGMFIYSAEVGGENLYWTQLVRPIFMSHDAEPEAQEILVVIKEAGAAAVKEFRPGKTISDVAAAVEKVVAENGCTVGIWSGHGMGIDLGDGVNIGVPNHMPIVPNMILTLHPSVIGKSDGLLYGNTWKSSADGDAVCMTPEYKDIHFYDELKALIK